METRTRKRERLEAEEDANQRINRRSLLNILDDCTLRVDELLRVARSEKQIRDHNIWLLVTKNIFLDIDTEGLHALDIIRDGHPQMSTAVQAVGGLDMMLAALRQQITSCPALSRRPT